MVGLVPEETLRHERLIPMDDFTRALQVEALADDSDFPDDEPDGDDDMDGDEDNDDDDADADTDEDEGDDDA